MTATTPTTRRTAAQTRALLLAALTEAPAPVTITDLAEAAGLGKSTLRTHLPALEEEGKAVRTPGGRDGRRRTPDLWEATNPAVSNADDTAEPERAPHEENASHSTVKEQPAPRSSVPDASSFSGNAGGAETKPKGVSHTSAAPLVPVIPGQDFNKVSGSVRLAPGELKVMVMALLDAEPDQEFTATSLSHLLAGRSIGAIQNNLARLAKEGRAVQTCDRPRRYRSAKYPA